MARIGELRGTYNIVKSHTFKAYDFILLHLVQWNKTSENKSKSEIGKKSTTVPKSRFFSTMFLL